MAQVIGGELGGRVLHVPRGESVRPSMGVVKKAIFSSLGEWLEGVTVLDLFAGVGSLGIEALSRGAASVAFVERDRRVLEFLRRNLTELELEATIHEMDALLYLTRMAPPGGFDIVFADPPYPRESMQTDYAKELLAHPGLLRTLRKGGLFILERPPGSGAIEAPGWEMTRVRRYGRTEVVHLRHAED